MPLAYQTHISLDQLREAGADAVIDGLATLTPEWIERRFCILTPADSLLTPVEAVIRVSDATDPCHKV